MYLPVIFLHSALRWLVLLAMLSLCICCFLGWRARREWQDGDENHHYATLVAVDCQLVVGLWLYVFLSPISHAFWSNPTEGMHATLLRFFGLEHGIGMLTALVILQSGRVWSKRSPNDTIRHRRVWTTTMLALIIVAISIPWPFFQYGRPLFRLPV